MNRRSESGLTLLELLVFSAIFSLVIVSFITILVEVTGVQAQQSAAGETVQQGQFLLQDIQSYVNSARIIDMPTNAASPLLTLQSQSSTRITISGGVNPITIVQATGSVISSLGTSSLALSFGSGVTASDTIIVPVQWVMSSGTSSLVSVTDSLGNQFTIVTSTFAAQYSTSHYSEVATELAYATNSKAGADTVTISWSRSIAAVTPAIMEMLPSTLDQTAMSTGTSNAPSAGTFQATSEEFAIAIASDDDGSGWGSLSLGSGNWSGGSNGAGSFSMGLEYQTLAAPGSITGNFSDGAGSGKWAAMMASFEPLATSGQVYVTIGSSTPQPLTSNKVSVSNLSFTRHFSNASTSAYGTDSVTFSYTVNPANANQTQSSQSFQSSAAVGKPVPAPALVQQAKVESGNVSVASLTATYANPNEGGDLLIAVVANAGSSTVTLSDYALETWTRVASGYDPTYGEQVNVYATTVLYPSFADFITATFGSGASNGALYIYEYRGVSIFDASSVSTQASSVSTSGFANATSAIELVFGGDVNETTSEVPSAGSGFTFDTSSTPANSMHLFVEDGAQYVTGPVAATWNYTGSPGTLGFVATFY